MARSTRWSFKGRRVFRLAWGLGAVFLLLMQTTVSAQLSRVALTVSSYIPGGIMRGTDAAWDPVNNVYLEVVGNGPIYGVFVNANGQAVAPGFAIFANDGSTWAHFPRVEYGAAVNGGKGGFLVTWNRNIGSVNYVFGRMVSYSAPGYLLNGEQLLSDGGEGGTWHETGPAMAYSATSQRFLVAWRSIQYGIRGRFVSSDGAASGGIIQLENPGGSRDPALAWNPATDEFGLVYTGFGGSGAYASFRRIAASTGSVSGRTSFGFSSATFATGIDVNANSEYVLAWAIHPGTLSARFDRSGNLVSGGTLVTSRFGYDQSLAIAFNNTSQSLIAVGSDGQSWEVAAAEMNSSGSPITPAQIVTDGATPNSGGSFYPMAAQRPWANQWNIVYSRDFRGATTQIMTTASNGATAAATSTSTPATPTTPPTTTASSCPTADPFASLGGGVCCNGGWLPPGMGCASGSSPASTPSLPTSSSTTTAAQCTTANPFASLGGGVCCNGGWLPPGMTCAYSSPTTTTTTTTSTSSSGCTGSDPFASIAGMYGVCVNGGWVPRLR
jgi:hypothetical protein